MINLLLSILRYTQAMLLPSRHSLPHAAHHGFSLVELSVVVAIIGVMATLGLEVAANFVNRNATSISRERLKAVDEAVASFFKIYGRLPCPAVKTTPPENANYGVEDCAGSASMNAGGVGNGLLVGAVPFRALNLPASFALDGFNNKINYVVTTNLTAAGGNSTEFGRFASTSGTKAQNGVAGIEVRSGVLEHPCSTAKCQVLADPTVGNPNTSKGAAYFIFSSGADQRGAVSLRGEARKPCANPVASSDMRVDTQNCVFADNGLADNSVRGNMTVSSIPYYVFYDNRYNAGLNLSSYFDDVAVWRGKDQL